MKFIKTYEQFSRELSKGAQVQMAHEENEIRLAQLEKELKEEELEKEKSEAMKDEQIKDVNSKNPINILKK